MKISLIVTLLFALSFLVHADDEGPGCGQLLLSIIKPPASVSFMSFINQSILLKSEVAQDFNLFAYPPLFSNNLLKKRLSEIGDGIVLTQQNIFDLIDSPSFQFIKSLLIVDEGAFVRAEDLSGILQVYLDVLEMNGHLLIPGNLGFTHVQDKISGELIPLYQWIQKLQGVETKFAHLNMGVEITKKVDHVQVPRLLIIDSADFASDRDPDFVTELARIKARAMYGHFPPKRIFIEL